MVPRPPPDRADRALGGSLGTFELTLMGIGGVVGTGVFVMTGQAAAQHAGPAVALSFLLSAVAALLCGLCYAEMASMIATSGSTYSYVLATLGELPAFVIGWNLMLEYGVAAAYVSVGWSQYFYGLWLGARLPALPDHWLMAPWAWDAAAGRVVATGAVANLPALAILLLVAAALSRGLTFSLRLTGVVVAVKLAVIVLFVSAAGSQMQLQRLIPFLPPNQGRFGLFGASGVLQAATLLFFTYSGFDAISTAAKECRQPQQAVPRAMLICLSVAAVLYVLVALVLCGAVDYRQLSAADPLAVCLRGSGLGGLAGLVAVGALVGLTSVLMLQIFGQVRILRTMCLQGCLPPSWARVHPRRRVPVRLTWAVAGVAGLMGALAPHEVLGELTSMGTLLAFGLVAVGVMRLRATQPHAPRPFRLPGPAAGIPLLAATTCLGLLASCSAAGLWRLMGWSVVGLSVFVVGRAWRPAAGG